jgi:hypothetical protein
MIISFLKKYDFTNEYFTQCHQIEITKILVEIFFIMTSLLNGVTHE